MNYKEIEDIFSAQRMQKYVQACGGDTRHAMTLYRYNLKLSQEMFTLVSCFEVALRNRIDKQMTLHLGGDWLRDAILPNGVLYYDPRVEKTRKIIEKAYNELMRGNDYSHSKLLSEMEFGVWKYMFSNAVYALTGQVATDTSYVLNQYARMMRLFNWMDIDGVSLMFGLDHVNSACSKIMCL